MPTIVERIQYVVEASTGAASKSFQGLKTDIANAEGAGGKFKAGISSIGDTLKTHMGLALAGAGTAITGFVAKGISAFQDLALAAGKTSAATGLSIQDASRWIEVTGDLGVNMDTVAAAVNRLNKEAGQGKLAAFGINAEDANTRLLQTLQYLQSIPDEATRAKVATELLGKSWTELAPLVAKAGELSGRLKDVSDAKVIDPAEQARAERFRDAMDNLNDIFEDFSITIGEDVVPALTAVAGLLQRIDELANKLNTNKGLWGNAPGWVKWLREILPGGVPKEAMTDFERRQGGAGNFDTTTGAGGEWMTTTTTPTATTVINNFPPGTSPRTTKESLEDWYRRNGGRP